MKKKTASFFDKKGKLYVDCTECTRGSKGTDPDKCSAGSHIKKPNQGGCFIGTPNEETKEVLGLNRKEELHSEFALKPSEGDLPV